MAVFMFSTAFISDPGQAREIDFADRSTLDFLLSAPERVDSEDVKRQAPVLCGARYWPDAMSRDKENVEHVETLVLDVDAAPVSEEQLVEALSGLRAIVYTSPRHQTSAPRWRVLLPLLSPLPPKKHRALIKILSDGLVPGAPGCINVQSTGDCTRLGFFGASFHPEDYRYLNLPGAYFDWTPYDLEDEVWSDATKLGGMGRSTLWTSREVALRKVLKKYDGYATGMKKGDGRSRRIWDVALNVWWAWAAEDEDFVMTVLRHVNDQFDEPEEEAELDRQMREAHKRTIGENRQPQGNGTYGWAREPENLIGHQSIIEHARRMRRRHNVTPENLAVSEALKRLAKGETLSDDIEAWRGLVTKCAHELARAFPHETAERISAQFVPSLTLMSRTGKADVPGDGEVYAYVQTRLVNAQRQIEAREERKTQQLEAAIEAATYGERDKPYTREEIEGWRRHVGLRDHNWLIVNGSVVYVFCNGTWIGPLGEKLEFEAQGRKALMAAQDKGGIRVTHFSEEEGAAVAIPLKELVHKHGCVAQVRVEMQCERSYFRTDDDTLILAGPKRRPLEPTYHADVDEWLRLLCGRSAGANKAEASKWLRADKFDAVCDWLAAFPEVEHPCKALYIEGEPGIGKGLFADGVARYYRAGHLSIDKAFHQFNSQLAETPFVLIDEGLPAMHKPGDILRRALAAREHDMTRKNKDTVKVGGCLRMLITANNDDLFREIKQRLRSVDMTAIENRIVHIRANEAAGDYLRSLGAAHHEFVTKDKIAEHMLWLHEERWPAISRRNERFLIVSPNEPDEITVSETLAVTSYSADVVCDMVCQEIVERSKSNWLHVVDGQVLVNSRGLTQQLVLQGHDKKLDGSAQTEVVRALRSMSNTSGTNSVLKYVGKKRVRLWQVSNEKLRAWCRTTEVFSWEEDVEPIILETLAQSQTDQA